MTAENSERLTEAKIELATARISCDNAKTKKERTAAAEDIEFWEGKVVELSAAPRYHYRCNRCHAPMTGLTCGEDGAACGACECGGLIEADPQNWTGALIT